MDSDDILRKSIIELLFYKIRHINAQIKIIEKSIPDTLDKLTFDKYNYMEELLALEECKIELETLQRIVFNIEHSECRKRIREIDRKVASIIFSL